ncbi:MAG: sulfur dioxygenase [Gammaproteobacteria bacterium]|jgi:sulfur dioxygenase
MAITAEDMVKAAKAEIEEISVADAKGLVGSGVVFIDVREPPEWQAGTVADALCIPRGVLEWRSAADEPLKDKSKPIIVYCKSGGRSALAAQTLQKLGFGDVKSMAGGYEAWSA